MVHGPLIASYLVYLCREQTGGRPFENFYFGAKRPLFANIPFEIAGGLNSDRNGFWLKAQAPDGAEAMETGGTFVTSNF